MSDKNTGIVATRGFTLSERVQSSNNTQICRKGRPHSLESCFHGGPLTEFAKTCEGHHENLS